MAEQPEGVKANDGERPVPAGKPALKGPRPERAIKAEKTAPKSERPNGEDADGPGKAGRAAALDSTIKAEKPAAKTEDDNDPDATEALAKTAVKTEKPSAKPDKTAVMADKPAEESNGEAEKPAKPAKAAKAAKAAPRRQVAGVWGIDLGQCGLKAIRLVEENGLITATAFDYVEYPKILSQPDADPDALTREALDKFLSRNQLKGDTVAISVPGHGGLARFVKLPPVEEKKIGDIVRFEAKQQIPFNLDEVVWDYQKLGAGAVEGGFALDTEIGLFAMKRDAVGRYLQHFKDVHVEVHLVQMAPLALCNFVAYDLLNKGSGGEESTDAKKQCVVALDIGTDSSNLIITDGDRIIWQRPINLGGNHFTRALTKDLKLTFAKAEHLKRNAMKSPDLKKILASIKPVLNDFVNEVQRSLTFFANSHRDAHIQYMMGLGNAFRLPGLQRYMAEKLALEVRKLEKFERLAGDSVVAAPAFTENVLSFAVAYGLAVQGLKQARLLTNLLPPEIRFERLIKAKKPWAVATAASLLLAIGGMTLGYAMDWTSNGGPTMDAFEKQRTTNASALGEALKKEVGDTPFAKALVSGRRAMDEAEKAKQVFQTTKDNATSKKKAVETIVSGQAEQLNWLELNHFIDDAIVRPADALHYPVTMMRGNVPCKNLSEKLLWLEEERSRCRLPLFVPPLDGLDDEKKTAALKEAEQRRLEFFELYVKPAQKAHGEWIASRSKVSSDDQAEGMGQLLQFQIVSVNSRYCSKLNTQFWASLKKEPYNAVLEPANKYMRPLGAEKTPPGEGDKGWIIELRGYTYHSAKAQAVVDVLMENIAERAQSKPKYWPLLEQPEESGVPAGSAKPDSPPGGADQPAAPMGPISHVMRVNHTTIRANDGTPFMIIGTSKLDDLLGGGGGGGGGSAQGPASGNVSGTGRPGSGAPAQGPGGSAAPGGGGRSGGGSTSTWKPLVAVDTTEAPGTGATGAAKTEPKYNRTEFVILFIWREKTPSDGLLESKNKPSEGDQGQNAGTPAAPPPSSPSRPREDE